MTSWQDGQVSHERITRSRRVVLQSRTDDVFKSTRHRAVNRSGVERHSIPLFFGTDYNVLLEVCRILTPQSTCLTALCRHSPAASRTTCRANTSRYLQVIMSSSGWRRHMHTRNNLLAQHVYLWGLCNISTWMERAKGDLHLSNARYRRHRNQRVRQGIR